MFKIKLSGITFKINNIHDELISFCHDYLSDDDYSYEIDINQEDIELEREYSARQDIKEGKAIRNYPNAYLETLALYRKLANPLLDNKIVIFHGAVVVANNKAYLFTAPSGTGKTTHIRLWLKEFDDTYVLNGDKPLLMIKDNKVYAVGTPWMGKEKMGINKIVELDSICVLDRSIDNRIIKLDKSEALSYLAKQIHIPDNRIVEILNVLTFIINNINLYHLYCNKEDEAAHVSYREMVNYEHD